MVAAQTWASLAIHRPRLGLLSISRYPSRLLAPASNLSAIHRGIRQSERAQHGEQRDHGDSFGRTSDGSRSEYIGTIESPGTAALRARYKHLEKLKREKATRTNLDEPQSRRKRFYNPETNFGKDSLVYKAKLSTTQNEPPQPERRPRSRRSMGSRDDMRSRSGRIGEQQFLDSFHDNSSRSASRPLRRVAPRDDAPRFSRTEEQSRPRRTYEDRGRNTRSSREGERPRMSKAREDGGRSFRDRERPRTSAARDDVGNRDDVHSAELHGADSPEALRRKGMIPMTVKYTTAASQFLYGRSVVKSALSKDRRKFYNLYVHASDDRNDMEMIALAKARGVPITNMPREKQRLMDKMSMGRPHNGFVLEASPLSQPPVTSLGRLEQTPGRLGFHVELGYQSKEDLAINGADTFVRRASSVTPKPLVLLLNEILDPGNMGAMLRTASYMGVDAVAITNRTSSKLTPVVLKSAAGAVEEVPIFTVDSAVDFLEGSKRAGWKVYAAVAPPDAKLVRLHKNVFVSADDVERTRPLDSDPCILVLGNEGHGLSKPIRVAADHQVSVPRFAADCAVDSLNVSVAAGLLCHSFMREKQATPAETKKVDEGAKAREESPRPSGDEAVF